MNDPFEGVNWSEIRAEIATIERVNVGDTVAIEGHWPYLDRPRQPGRVTRLYQRRSQFAGTTVMARIRWQDGSYSAVEAGRLVLVEATR